VLVVPEACCGGSDVTTPSGGVTGEFIPAIFVV
jgi:hypothetical protein